MLQKRTLLLQIQAPAALPGHKNSIFISVGSNYLYGTTNPTKLQYIQNQDFWCHTLLPKSRWQTHAEQLYGLGITL